MPIGAKTMNFFAKSDFFDYKLFFLLLRFLKTGTLGPRGPGAQGPWGPGALGPRGKGKLEQKGKRNSFLHRRVTAATYEEKKVTP